MKALLNSLALTLALVFFAPIAPSAKVPAKLLPLYDTNEDGIHSQPWINETFKDVVDDMETASSEGKRLLYIYEQKGCWTCVKMHEINFRYPQIVDYLNKHFYVVQINMRGVNEVTDIDGKVMGENDFSARSAVNKTPTLQFFPANLNVARNKNGIRAEAYRFIGYQKPEIFLNQLAYIQRGHFKRQPNFINWYKKGAGLIKLEPVLEKND